MNLSMINTMTGMGGIQYKIDQLADQLANVDTVGYKRKAPSFTDILNSRLNQPAGFQLNGRRTPAGLPLAHGARLAGNQTVWEQGGVKETGQPTDLMIEGSGLFELAADESGARRFTRSGSFQLAPQADGTKLLVTSEGVPLLDVNGNAIDIPGDATWRVDERGNVYAGAAAGGGETFITTVRYIEVRNPQMLERTWANTYRIAAVNGVRPDQIVQNVNLNNDALGLVKQGALETSNVDVGWTMSELLTAQRSYALNARALASVDTMNGLINNIRG